MQYIELKETLKDFIIFSLNDIRSVDNNFFRARLNEWQDKGYIKKIIKGYYIFSDLKIDENILFEIANKIYNPSYISLEMALSYYHLIPESVYSITSISTRKTYRFNTQIANFNYRTIKPDLFFGYNLISYNNRHFKIASIEKAILDYFYINSNIKTKNDFKEIRINKEVFVSQIDKEKLNTFLEKFNNKALKERIYSFMEFIKNA